MTKGVVGKIYSKDFGDQTAWSFTLRGDRTFYRLGNKKPAFSEGDSVQFEVEMKGSNAYARGVSPWSDQEVTRGSPAQAVAGASGPRTADDFWRRKEQRDIETQKRIELQSCRNSAIEMVALIVKAEALKLPAKASDKAPVIEELVQHYTQFFLDRNAGKETVEKIDTEAAVEAVVETKKEDNNDDWN